MNYNQPNLEAERLFVHDFTLGNVGTQFCRLLGFVSIKIIQSDVGTVDLRVDGVLPLTPPPTFLPLRS